jgi:hypothetical protein
MEPTLDILGLFGGKDTVIFVLFWVIVTIPNQDSTVVWLLHSLFHTRKTKND